MKGRAIGAVPIFRRLIAILVKDGGWLPVLRFLGQIVTPLDQQHTRPAVAQPKGQRAPAHAAADDDDVEVR